MPTFDGRRAGSAGSRPRQQQRNDPRSASGAVRGARAAPDTREASPRPAAEAEGAPVRRGSGPANPLAVGVVTALTEALRVLGVGRDRYQAARETPPPEPPLAPGDVDGLMRRITTDFGNGYFITGIIDSAIYDDQCRFVDPTVSVSLGLHPNDAFVEFSGVDLWKRNLALLTPFLISPSLDLQTLKRLGADADGTEELEATWALATWLNLPWRPLISIEGTTRFTLNGESNKVVRHVESWDVTATEALLQLFKATPGPPPAAQ